MWCAISVAFAVSAAICSSIFPCFARRSRIHESRLSLRFGWLWLWRWSHSKSTTYMGLILVWAAPICAIQWGFAGDSLVTHFRLVARCIIPPTLYPRSTKLPLKTFRTETWHTSHVTHTKLRRSFPTSIRFHCRSSVTTQKTKQTLHCVVTPRTQSVVSLHTGST